MNAILSTRAAGQRLAGLAETGDQLQHRLLGHHLANELTSQAPTAGVSSLGLNTTALPAASA